MTQVYLHIVYSVGLVGLGGYLGHLYASRVQAKAAEIASQVKKVI